MKAITQRQQEVLRYIFDFWQENYYPPTVREMCLHFKIAPKAIQDHLSALQKKGYLEFTQNRSRTIRLLPTAATHTPYMKKIPLLGTVAAGKPLLSEENLDGYVNVTEPFIKPDKSYFALKVRGESMIGAGILEGDLAIIERVDDADNGEIVVAVIDDGITIKRFFKEPARVRLQPENPSYPAIYSQDVRVVGKLVGIMRSYN